MAETGSSASGRGSTARGLLRLRGERGPRPPEGGGRARRGGSPLLREWPISVVLLGVVVGLILLAASPTPQVASTATEQGITGQARAGLILIGAAVSAGAVLRGVLPDVGLLAVRSRFTDVLTLGVLGGAILFLALILLPEPVIPVGNLGSWYRFWR